MCPPKEFESKILEQETQTLFLRVPGENTIFRISDSENRIENLMRIMNV